MLLPLFSCVAVCGSLLVRAAPANTSNFSANESPRAPRDAANLTRRPPPLVIAHRGASGYLPEATLAAYDLAAEQGADYLEIDVIMTKDGHLIACHDPDLNYTTDVSTKQQFSDRKRTANLHGAAHDGFFATDFTLAEIKTLTVRQVFLTRPQQLNRKFQIATLREIIHLTKRKSLELNRTIGVYVETKMPTYHREAGLALEPALIEELQAAGWLRRPSPVILQSFEPTSLQTLRQSSDLQLVQLIDATGVNSDGSINLTAPYDTPYDWQLSNDSALRERKFDFFVTDEGLREVATYADGIGPFKRYIITTVLLNGSAADTAVIVKPTNLITRAHQAGLFVHGYTFRSEYQFLPAVYQNNAANELLDFFAVGLDGVITDFADTAVSARKVFSHMERTRPIMSDNNASI